MEHNVVYALIMDGLREVIFYAWRGKIYINDSAIIKVDYED